MSCSQVKQGSILGRYMMIRKLVTIISLACVASSVAVADFDLVQNPSNYFVPCHSGKPAKSKKSLRRRFFGGGGRSDCSADLRGLTLA